MKIKDVIEKVSFHGVPEDSKIIKPDDMAGVDTIELGHVDKPLLSTAMRTRQSLERAVILYDEDREATQDDFHMIESSLTGMWNGLKLLDPDDIERTLGTREIAVRLRLLRLIRAQESQEASADL